MKLDLRRPALAGSLVLAAFCLYSAAQDETDSTAPQANAPLAANARRVIDLTRTEKTAMLRLRVPPQELRETLYRLLDEDGFRVTRVVGDIPPEGQTLRAKKHLRRVECELAPDHDPNISTLNFEYARFGNQSWADRAIDLLIIEVSKNDPADPAPASGGTEAPRTVIETPAPPTPAKQIPSVDYFDPKYAAKNDSPMPIPALSIDPDAPATFERREPAPAQVKAPKPAERTDAAPNLPPASGGSAEMLTLPGQKSGEHPSEALFRSVQRGDIDEKSGEERINGFLQVAWIDARRAPSDPQRRDLSHWLAHALSERQIGSKDAGGIVALIDRAVSAKLSPEASGELVQKLRAIVERSELEQKDRDDWITEIGALLSPPAAKN